MKTSMNGAALDFVLPGLPLGGVGLIAGARETASAFVMRQAIEVALGLGGAKAGGVLLFAAEDDRKSLTIKCRDIMKGLSRGEMERLDRNFFPWACSGYDVDIVGGDDNPVQRKISNTIAAHPWLDAPRLVILDSLWKFGAEAAIEDGEYAMDDFMNVMHRIARLTGCAVLVTHRSGRAEDEAAHFADCCAYLRPMTPDEADELETPRERYFLHEVTKVKHGPRPAPMWHELEGSVLKPAVFGVQARG